jgi:hypothetical protein
MSQNVRYGPTVQDVLDVSLAAHNEVQYRGPPGGLRKTLENILSRVYNEGLLKGNEHLLWLENRVQELEAQQVDASFRLEAQRHELERGYYREGRPGYGEMGG